MLMCHTTAFLSETLSQSDHCHRLFSILRDKIPSSDQTALKTLNLAVETLENAISSTETSPKSSSLRLGQKLLLCYPETPFSSFLLSLIYTLYQRPTDATLHLLDLFSSDPSLARSEIAPDLFENLFLVRLLPILQWFNDQRSRILSTLSSSMMNSVYDSDERSNFDEYVVIPCTKSLSKMSGDQTLELEELERDYEEVVDENCRVCVGYLKEVLGNKDENRLIKLLSLVLRKIGEKLGNGGDEKINEEDFRLKNRRIIAVCEEGRRWSFVGVDDS